MERLKSALENLDQAIDMAEAAVERRNKAFDRIVEDRAVKRIKTATDMADEALRQAHTRETAAAERVSKQKTVSNKVAARLDQAIMRLEKMVSSG